MNVPTPCDAYQEELAELALGTLTGRDRAETLAHVEGCGRCAGEVEELSRAADMLLQVASEAEPPVGFEVRLLERVASEQQTARDASRVAPVIPLGTAGGRRARARRWVSTVRGRTAVAVAAAAVAVAGIGIGLSAGDHANPVQPHAVQATLLSATGRPVGRVVASGGKPTWLLMVVQRGALSGRVTCRVDLTGGHWVTLGTFSLGEGYNWSAPLAAPVSAVHEAELVGPHGTVVATAVFPTPA
jgi:hypothetical protein